MGVFDPMNTVTFLDDELGAALDTGGVLPRSEISAAGSPINLSFATYLHETTHWWQHAGSTTGLLYGLSVPIQATVCAAYLTDVGTSLPKPLLANAYDENPTAGLLACLRWSEIEHGACHLYNPFRFNAQIQANSRWFRSTGHSLLLLLVSTIAALRRDVDPEGLVYLDPLPWLDHEAKFEADGVTGFEPGDLIDLPLGMMHLCEAQGRLCELQFRSRTHEFLSWSDVEARGLLVGDYAVAFHEFLSRSGLPTPDHPNDAVVDMFLAVVDVALNPSLGFLEDITASTDLVSELMPAVRFMRLCQRLGEIPELLASVEGSPSEVHERWTGELCEGLGWATPQEVSSRLVDKMRKSPRFEELEAQALGHDFGVQDIPIRFYMASHAQFLDTRAQAPSFLSWPVKYLSGEDDEAMGHASSLLDLHLPPFLTSGLESGVTSANTGVASDEARTSFVSSYFLTQALYDLVRQWIAKEGEFRFDYGWSPRIAASEVEAIRARFRDIFGIDLDKIPR